MNKAKKKVRQTMKMKVEELPICTMDTGRWYAVAADNQHWNQYETEGNEPKVYDQHGREMPCFFIEDDYVCEELARRHEGDQQWEERWDNAMAWSGEWIDTAMEEEYEAMYKELAETVAEESGEEMIAEVMAEPVKVNSVPENLRKALILEALASSTWHEAYDKGWAFDIMLGEDRVEIGPMSLSGYWNGAYTALCGHWDPMPELDPKELAAAYKKSAQKAA